MIIIATLQVLSEVTRGTCMDLTRLAAKQKRYIDIQHFTANEAPTPEMKLQLQRTLAAYRAALARSWIEKDALTPETEAQLANIERELDALHNQARLLSQ